MKNKFSIVLLLCIAIIAGKNTVIFTIPAFSEERSFFDKRVEIGNYDGPIFEARLEPIPFNVDISIKTSLDRKEYDEIIKIYEEGSLAKFKERYTKLELSPNATYSNDKDFIYDSLLTLAALRTSNPEIIEFLLSNGADINSRSKGWREIGPDFTGVSNMTALMKASICYHKDTPSPEIVKALLEAGSDINAKDSDGMTALDWALDTFVDSKASKEIIDVLLDAGANAKYSLQFAFDEHDCPPEVLKKLLKAGADVNIDANLLISIVSITEYPEVIEILLDAGVDAKVKSNTKDIKGKRAIDFAGDNPHLKNTNALKKLEKASYESPEEREREEAKKKAADQGDSVAMSQLGIIYRNGMAGVKKDDQEADYWFDKRQKTIEAQKKSTFQANASITGDKVNIRAQPNTSAKILKQLNAGHPVKAIKQTAGKDGKWYFIQTASGTEGWVFGKYLKIK